MLEQGRSMMRVEAIRAARAALERWRETADCGPWPQFILPAHRPHHGSLRPSSWTSVDASGPSSPHL